MAARSGVGWREPSEQRRPLAEVPSGTDLVDQGFSVDVSLAEELDADDVVPVLRDGRYIAAD